MGRSCTICRHESKEEINKGLLAGQPYRTIAKHYEASESSVFRHQQDHLPVALSKAIEAKAVAHGGTLLEQLQELQAQASSILVKAEAAGDLRTALAGVKEIRGTLELIAKLTGELVNRHEVNVNVFTISQHLQAIYAGLPLEVLERRIARLDQLLAAGDVTHDSVMPEELWGPRVIESTGVVEEDLEEELEEVGETTVEHSLGIPLSSRSN